MLLLVGILITVNVLSGFVFTRIDMTQEKRYSLSPSSKELARKLDDIVFFRVYLEGELPPGFNKLKNSMREMLDEFKVYAGDKIDYEFIDPSENPDEKQKKELYKQLAEKGLYPTTLEEKQEAGQSQKIIFPGAIVTYRSKEFPMQLLKSRMGSSPEEMLNISAENLEYEIATMLRKITLEEAPHIGILQGQHEVSDLRLADAVKALSEFYAVDTVTINNKLKALDGFKAVIIAGPDSAFDEKDKFIIDQYIMHGGSVLWMIDHVLMNMDSLSTSSTSLALPLDLNLDDMLFRYGVRINTDLIQDLQCAPIPVVTGYVGNQPRQKLFPWYYFPLLETESSHPIVHNLNAVKGEFVNSIDTIEIGEVKKTILLTTGKFTRVQMTPARVSINMVGDKPDPRAFTRKYVPCAVLLEGNFTSNYLNRIPSQLANAPEINFKGKSENSRMIVVSDADIIMNYVSKKGNIFPLGYDRFTGQTYGNRNFILNCADYLCGNKGILELRGKDFRLRLLDPAKTANTAAVQWMNILIPAVIVILFALIFGFVRTKKFTA
jgi:ABC-2 type transport system permease protein